MVIPWSLFVLFTYAAVNIPALKPYFLKYKELYPSLTLIAGLVLGWRFHRVRLIYLILLLTLSDRLLLLIHHNRFQYPDITPFVHHFIVLCLPLNIIYLAVVKDRGVFSFRGGAIISVIFAQLIFGLLMYYYLPSAVLKPVGWSFFPTTWTASGTISSMSLLFFMITILFLIARFMRYRSVIESSLIWIVIAILFGLLNLKHDFGSSTYFSTAVLIFIVSILELSYRLAYYDELTGLPARRSLNKLFLELSGKYTIAMVDIDHFKKINDRFGHDVGDDVLRMVAVHLSNVKGGGKAFRYGGEEFAIVFTGKTTENVIPFLEQLRGNIEHASFAIRKHRRPAKETKSTAPGLLHRILKMQTEAIQHKKVTVSIGVAGARNKHDTPEMVMKIADQALYKAKRAGRNRVHPTA